jgi:NTE family protein
VTDAIDSRPDVLVLGGGGILGEAWMLGVLAGLEEAAGIDARAARSFVGTSAGSIVAAVLVGGVRPRERMGAVPAAPEVEEPDAAAGTAGVLGAALELGRSTVAAAIGAVAPLALRTTEAGGALARRVALARMPRGRRSLRGLGAAVERTGTRFDGRLRIAAVDLDSGRRVMFGAPGAPPAGVGEAVEASCAIPGVFHPIEIGGRTYVDGGAWSPTNMDTAPAERGDRVLCLNPTASLRGAPTSPMRALAQLSRSVARVEQLALERRGASVVSVAPDAGSARAMGSNLMDARARDAVAAAGVAQGRALAG